MSDKKVKIILAGGGTLGSVSPLLAIADKYQARYLFVGSHTGPEKKIIEDRGIDFVPIKSGKLRRYFDWKNFSDFIKIKWAFFQSLQIISNFKPDIVLTAGSFVAVPVVWAAWLLRVPVVVHQQDIQVGLANKLVAPFAKKITVTFKEQVADFKHDKVVITGNPVRQMKIDETYKAIVVITGGGLGARHLNDFIKPFIPKLLEKYEVHHVLGDKNWDQKLELEGYYPYKFIKRGMINMLSQADIIISRAGMSLITEVAMLKKALVLVPIPDSHQERNAAFFAKKNAAIMVKQGSDKIMGRYLDKLIESDILRTGLGNNLHKTFPKYAVKDYTILINELI